MNKFKLSKSFFTGSISTGTMYVVIIMALLIVFSAMMTNGITPPDKDPTGPAVTIVPPQLDSGRKNLQLYTFGFTTPAPTSPPITPPVGNTCQTMIKPPTCDSCTHGDSMICPDDQTTCDSQGGIFVPFGWYEPQYTCAYLRDPDPTMFNQKKTDPSCVEACIAKPVIYLYPTLPTLVDVRLRVPGKIFISDPLYPEGGWKNVLAYPDGKLIYKEKEYKELFFESDVDKVNPPDNGIIIAKKDLKKTLDDSITKLGLIGAEKEEFLDFWIPILNDLNTPYVLFSILDPVEKERVDHVDISPTPDTFIAFIAYFKGLDSVPQNLKPLPLPEKPPVRLGFTAVEWGGTVDN